jgi:AcrR family transcriptional regulator
MGEVIEAALDRVEELIAAVPEDGEPLERLEAFVMARLRAIEAQPGIPSLVFSDQLAHALGAKGPRRVAALRNRGRAFVRSCLAEAAARGLVRRDLDLDAATLLVTGMVMSFLFASKDGALRGSAGEMRERAWQMLLAMLGSRKVKR